MPLDVLLFYTQTYIIFFDKNIIIDGPWDKFSGGEPYIDNSILQ